MSSAMRVRDYSAIVLAFVFGVGSLILFLAYPLGSLSPARLDWSEHWRLCWDAGLSLVFFVQHSGMNRRAFRARLGAVTPPAYHGAVYAIASSLALLLVVGFWQPVGVPVVTLHGIARLLVHGISLMASAVLVWGFMAIVGHDPLGFRLILARRRGADEPKPEFMVRGPYRWVRHPLYSGAIVLFWASPDTTLDRLLFNVLWSIWICLGARLEERAHVNDLGSAYR